MQTGCISSKVECTRSRSRARTRTDLTLGQVSVERGPLRGAVARPAGLGSLHRGRRDPRRRSRSGALQFDGSKESFAEGPIFKKKAVLGPSQARLIDGLPPFW